MRWTIVRTSTMQLMQDEAAQLRTRAQWQAECLGRCREEIASLRATTAQLEEQRDNLKAFLQLEQTHTRELETELLDTIRSVRAHNFPATDDGETIVHPPTIREADQAAARGATTVRPPPSLGDPT